MDVQFGLRTEVTRVRGDQGPKWKPTLLKTSAAADNGYPRILKMVAADLHHTVTPTGKIRNPHISDYTGFLHGSPALLFFYVVESQPVTGRRYLGIASRHFR